MNPEARLFIDGELLPAASGKTYPNINPATEEVMGEVADAGAGDMERAIAAARRAFDTSDWASNHALRHTCLQQLYDALREVEEEFKQQIAAETGAPLGICGDMGPQCSVPIGFMQYTLEQLPQFQWRRDAGVSELMGIPSRRLVEKEPIGVVGCITPWNVPLQINLAKCVPALAAGCSVVLKAAPDTPWSATMLGRLVAEKTDMPAGVFNVITAADPVETGEQLVTDPRVDMISFTGSTAVGKHIMARAAGTVKKVFLELGGKSANILLDDADLNAALLSCLGVCFHAGQGCAILTRLLVPKSRQAEVEELLPTFFGFIEYGDPSSGQIMGALINAKQRERVLGYIEKGKAEGARLLMGGGTPAHLDRGYYVEPTVFTDVSNDMTIAREEIFGPVLTMIPYETEEEAIAIANDTEYGLAGYVQSGDIEHARKVAAQIRAGNVSINGSAAGFNVPFGGYKQSGNGREWGSHGFTDYLEIKAVQGYHAA